MRGKRLRDTPGEVGVPLSLPCEGRGDLLYHKRRGHPAHPGGERTVRAGELLFFPAGEGGAHKLTNTGEGPLTYIDFDAVNDLDAAVYLDSGKLGVWGMGVNRVFRLEDEAGYYEGE